MASRSGAMGGSERPLSQGMRSPGSCGGDGKLFSFAGKENPKKKSPEDDLRALQSVIGRPYRSATRLSDAPGHRILGGTSIICVQAPLFKAMKAFERHVSKVGNGFAFPTFVASARRISAAFRLRVLKVGNSKIFACHMK